ncbi:head-tail adaptor protein [Pseudomonas cremoricolorata]|uniref:head-tail adaptor protein n=1 Tax=Pseudomonas cremoricolorata TaxID=157783 RepID=UPI0009DEF9D1|nr:head-tail adaptor protein [Pseudomonas cremoricolorata]
MQIPRIGELTRRVYLRVREDIANPDDPGLQSQYLPAPKTWAKIQPVGNAIYSGSVQTGKAVTHRIILRFRSGITDAHEVVETYRGVDIVYRVRRVSDLGNRLFTVLEVEELGQALDPAAIPMPDTPAGGGYVY